MNDIIIAYINSRNYQNNQENNINKKEEIIPNIINNRIKYTERIYKIENIIKKHPNYKCSLKPIKKISVKNKIPLEILSKLEASTIELNTSPVSIHFTFFFLSLFFRIVPYVDTDSAL